MRFSLGLPIWALALLALAVAGTAWFAYRRPAVPLSHPRRLTLTALRALALLVIVGCILRPVRLLPPDTPIAEVVPILVDTSRSMRLPDGRGQRRIDAARTLVQQQLEPALAARFHTELWAFGDGLTRADAQALGAEGGRSDLSGALSAVAERYRGRRVPAVIVVSDGGDTGHADAAAAQDAASHPVFTVGIGEPREGLDLEVSDVSAGDATLVESSIDLTVTAVSRASRSPFDLRVLENGRPIDVRRVTPTAAGSPVHTVFTVSPPASAATLYTIEIPAASGEDVLENNRRSVLVEPPGRRRRILMVEGAPGFEHTFLKRALDADTGLEVDSIVRKGRDAQGQATYLVQSSDERAPQLAAGFPADRAALFQYDALVLANVENDALTRPQLEMAAAFVGERGGGAVVLGAKSFAQRGLIGTVLEEVLPLSLADRGNGVVPASSRTDRYKVNITNDGEVHPVMRIGSTSAETIQRWSAVPALPGAAALGALRPGAQVLAVVQTPDGARPLVTVERYGQGRSMVFSGEATWRWRMQMAASDRTYELFWRQATRWLASGATDPVTIASLPSLSPGDATSIGADIRDASFMPVSGAQVMMRVNLPGGESRELHPTLTDPRTGRYASDFRFERAGVYRVVVEAKRGATSLGTAERWALVGGADIEMSDPRLNEDVLRRVSHTTGGEYFNVDTASRLAARLTSAGVSPAAPRVQELWQTPWLFAVVILLLAGEWVLRRQWGLR